MVNYDGFNVISQSETEKDDGIKELSIYCNKLCV